MHQSFNMKAKSKVKPYYDLIVNIVNIVNIANIRKWGSSSRWRTPST